MRIAMHEDGGSVRGGLNRIANRPTQIKMEIRFHPPLPTRSTTRAMVSVLCLPLVFPRSEKLQAFFRDGRRNFEALTVAKRNFIVYYHRIKERKERRIGGEKAKESERRKIVDTKRERYLLDCINRKAIERYRRKIRGLIFVTRRISGKDKRRETFLPS